SASRPMSPLFPYTTLFRSNVLRGEMTLVGPRPETLALAVRYPNDMQRVFAYRPGLTGPVQVRLRDVVSSDVEDVEAFYISELLPHRTELDLAYLNDPSLIATISLIGETAKHVVSRGVTKLVATSRRRAGFVGELKERTT